MKILITQVYPQLGRRATHRPIPSNFLGEVDNANVNHFLRGKMSLMFIRFVSKYVRHYTFGKPAKVQFF